VTEGELGAGDAIELLSRPEHGITVALVSDAILLDGSLRARAGSAPELAESLAAHLREDAA
jgi:MOSC domain-containing protein YiiM